LTNPYNIRGFKSAERKGPELFNFGPFLTEKAAGIEAKSWLRQHYLSIGDATEKIKDVRKGRKLVGFRAPSASAWISPVRTNSGYQGHPSEKHWAAWIAASNEYGLYTALKRCSRDSAFSTFKRLMPRAEHVGKITPDLAEYVWDKLHADYRKNPRRNPAAFIRRGKKYVAIYDQMTVTEAERKAAELRSAGKNATAGEVPGRGWGVYCVKNPRRNSGNIKRIDVDANRWHDGSGNTYHVVSVEVNGKHEWTSPITYGYGTQYEQTAMGWLKKAGYAASSDRSLHRFCNDRGITCSSRAHDVSRKKDLGV
jgi:hypothetical protein